jgi:hypothetical protein
MRVAYSQEQEQLRQELRDYFAQLVTPELAAELATGESTLLGKDGAYCRVIRQLGKDGWLGIGWPTEYGGQNRSMLEQMVFGDEATLADVPIPLLTTNSVGPTIMEYGTQDQKDFFLPRILAGELHFSIGYSGPGPLARGAVRRGEGPLGNADAWARDWVEPADLAASDRNPMMSWAYTRSRCSRAGVDQGAALLLPCHALPARIAPRQPWRALLPPLFVRIW